MLYILETVDIIAILLMLFMLAVVIRQQPSKAGIAFLLYDIFAIIFVIGIHLELMHSNTIGEALSGLCVQYVGQAGFFMALVWFTSEFVHFKIPKWVYILQVVSNIFVLSGIFTATHHHYFYASMKIRTDGLYSRIEVVPGILWYLHFGVHIVAVIFIVLILCILTYPKSAPIQKKRILYVAIGISILAFGLALKCTGFFGSYNPMVCFLTIYMFCMMMAMVRYGYFGSLHAAIDNAFNHGNEGLLVLDSDQIVIFSNQKMKKLFPNIKEGDNINSQKEIMEILNNKKQMISKDTIIYELRAEDIIEHGEKNGTMLWFIDQTENLQMMQKLKEADEAKTQFLMKVSHELRTPMNTMLGMNEMILRETKERKIKNYAENIAFAGENMLLLIDEILDISRLENKTMKIKQEIYSLIDVLIKAELLMRSQAEKKGLSFKLDIAKEFEDQDVFLYGDDIHILEVITNLLSNAIKYTDEGYVVIKAGKEERDGKNWLSLSVSDTGIGIEKEEQNQIFENFERGSNVIYGTRDGIGLGLAIVKQLVLAMHGMITVESEPKVGSTFFVIIPWLEVTEEEVENFKNSEKEKREHIENIGRKEIENTVIPDFHTKTILAVDDNEYNLMVLKFLLERTGIHIETVSNGNLAIQVCKKNVYDLILLDHMMPLLDGIETLHRIQEDREGKNRNTKVIAVTANAMQEAKELYFSEGFADYITKPIDPKELENLLCKYLSIEKQEDGISRLPKDKRVFLEIPGIDVMLGLQYADGDMEFYKRLLTIFVKEREKKKQKIEKSLLALTNGEWEAFISHSHGMKGEAKGIGAIELGELFYRLELAGREKNKERIETLYPIVIKEWNKIAEAIRKAIEL